MFHFCFEEAKIILFLVRTQEIKKKERVFAIININTFHEINILISLIFLSLDIIRKYFYPFIEKLIIFSIWIKIVHDKKDIRLLYFDRTRNTQRFAKIELSLIPDFDIGYKQSWRITCYGWRTRPWKLRDVTENLIGRLLDFLA